MHIDANAAKSLIERKGLSKVRHLDVDVLWLQQQQARRLLPIQKIAGTENPSDLMTKHLDRITIDKYVSILGMYMLEGRAEIAQKLHSIKRSMCNKDKWVWGNRRSEWGPATGICWTRQHNIPRRKCFTPCGETDGPRDVKTINSCRLTIGSCVSTGAPIYRYDSWRDHRTAHIDLGMSWIGYTIFSIRIIQLRGSVIK